VQKHSDKLKCPVICSDHFSWARGLIDEIDPVAQYFDGIYVCLGRQELFDGEAYRFCRDLAWAGERKTRIFYTYVAPSPNYQEFRRSLKSAIRIPSYYELTVVINFCELFLPARNSAALLEDAANLIVDWRKSDRRRFIKRCIIAKGLNPRLLRRLLKLEDAARQKARDEQAMLKIVCS